MVRTVPMSNLNQVWRNDWMVSYPGIRSSSSTGAAPLVLDCASKEVVPARVKRRSMAVVGSQGEEG